MIFIASDWRSSGSFLWFRISSSRVCGREGGGQGEGRQGGGEWGGNARKWEVLVITWHVGMCW